MRPLAAGLALAAALGGAPAAPAQDIDWRPWTHVAPVHVSVTGPRLVRIRIPPEVSRRAAAGWADLRIVDDVGREVPFVLHARTARRRVERRAARLLNVSRDAAQGTYATVDLGTEPAVHNGIELETPRREFFVRVAIDAGADGRRWRAVTRDAPLYRFASRGLEGNQTVRYRDNTSRYLRLRITDGPDSFPLTGVKVRHEVNREPELGPVDVVPEPDPAAPAGESWWTADAGAGGVPVSAARFAVGQPTFHRPVRVRASDDGRVWRTAGSGDIYRLGEGAGDRVRLRVEFGESRARFLRVEVVNRNDAALAGATVRLEGVPRYAAFRAEPGRAYRLLYGHRDADPARYDLGRLVSAADVAAADRATLGPGGPSPDYVDPAPWTERHPVVLWVALVLALGVIGGIALRALRGAVP